MRTVYCIGELLIDMVGVDNLGLKKGIKFEKKAGGAPANVAAAITKMKGKSSFLGQIGNDYFGAFLHDILRENDIDDSFCTIGGTTTVALVGLDENGERNFNFLRGCDKDFCLTDNMIKQLENDALMHFGSATGLIDGKLKESYFKLLKESKIRKNFISFDPNYRDSLITSDNLSNFIQDCKYFISMSDFVKMSEEEAFLITDKNLIDEAITCLHQLGAKTVVITLGEKGTYLSNGNERQIVPSIKINQIDSTGAGDAFVGAVLSQIAIKNPVDFNEWKEIIKFGNVVGALTCTAYGAIDSIPNYETVKTIYERKQG